MIRLSAFADEIAADPAAQLAVLADEGIRYVDLRGAWGTNVLALSDAQIAQLQHLLSAHGVRVAAIASPLGKAPIDAPFQQQLAGLERAIALAHTLATPYIRVFSFYPPTQVPSATPASYRDEAIRRLRAMVARARAAAVTLMHENEKGIYGDTAARCVDLLRGVDDPHFRAVLDPANYIQCGEAPYPDGYEALRPWLAYVHVKDATPGGDVVVAGAGAGRWPDLLRRLRDDGYDGVLSLEPHLATAGAHAGFSGPDLFRRAARALQDLLRATGWAYE